MFPAHRFQYCPRCGSTAIRFQPERRLLCGTCHLEYYINVAAAVGVLLTVDEGVLVTVRSNDPGRGLLDLPGGFVDPGETLEEAARREIREELGLKLDPETLRYLGSGTNQYEYKSITYHTLDAFFLAPLPEMPKEADPGEIESIHLLRKTEFRPGRFAFDSNKKILDLFFSHSSGMQH